MRVKILFVTYWYLPHTGGVHAYINLLKKELLKEGHHVDILAHHPDMDKIYMLTTGKYIEKEQIKEVVYGKVLNYYNRYQPYVEPWIRWKEIERYTFELVCTLFQLDQYDLIHTQDIVSTRALARVKPKHVPLVATIHGLVATQHLFTGEITSKKSLPWHYACLEEYYGATSADATIVPTEWVKRRLSKLGVPANHLTTIPYAIDIDQFKRRCATPTERYIPFTEKGKTIILCPAPLLPFQGHRNLMEALALLKERHQNFVCWLVGSGKLDQELLALSYRFRLENHVHFLGDRPDTAQLMNHSDIIVLPSTQDNNPYFIMEAQVAGKLVVSSNTGSTPEMIEDRITGLLFPPKNSRKLADILDLALSNTIWRKHIAEQGFLSGMKRWDSRTLLNNTLAVYHHTLEKRGLRKEIN
jgi:glycosyltransferase involved in cell wall biosynthesis